MSDQINTDKKPNQKSTRGKVDRAAGMSKAFVNEEKNNVPNRFEIAKNLTTQNVITTHPLVESKIETPQNNTADVHLDTVQDRVKLKLEDLIENPFNARKFYNEENITKLAASILQDGQQTPISVTPVPEQKGKFYIVDGQYRYRAIKFLGRTEIDVSLNSNIQTSLDLYKSSYISNEARSQQTPLDNAYAWSKLIDEKLVLKDEDIATLISSSKSNISRTLSILSLPDSILDRIKENPFSSNFTLSKLYPLSVFHKKYNSLERTSILFELLIKNELSSRQLEDYISNYNLDKQRKPRTVSRQHKVLFNNSNVGTFKEWDDGRLLIDINVKDHPELVLDLKEKLNIKNK